jgi:UDP-GlcNAc:undecaprenyl-phosphate GlcNAc-1-phosphate transferase
VKLVAILGFAAAFLLTAGLIVLLNPLAARVGLVDRPGGRKDHAQPTPVTGGLAIAIGAAIAAVACGGAGAAGLALGEATLLLLVVGFIDDIYDVRWYYRLAAQAVAGLILVYVGGVRVEQIGPVFGLSLVSLGVLSAPFTVLATVGLINALNMIDGLDGLAGTLVLCALAMLTAAAIYAGNAPLAVLLIITGGAVAGFLAFNLRTPWRKRANVFLGNAGSAVLGLIIAWASFRLTQVADHPVSAVLAPFFITLPVIDCLVLFLHRTRKHGKPFEADRTHMHHRMLDAGFTPTAVCVILGGTSLLIGLAAGLVRLSHAPQPLFIAGYFALAASYAWLTASDARSARFFARLNRWTGSKAPAAPQAPLHAANDVAEPAIKAEGSGLVSIAQLRKGRTPPPRDLAPGAAITRAGTTETRLAEEDVTTLSL